MTTIGLYAAIGATTGTLLGGVVGAIKGLLDKPIKPHIEWVINTPITFGTQISDSQLQARALVKGEKVDGKYVYNHEVGDVLQVGKHTLDVNFIPSNTTRYEAATQSVDLIVNPAPPSAKPFTPATPAQIHKIPPHFILTGMNISGRRSAIDGDPAMIARFHLHLQNAGESASRGMEIQIAMLNYSGNARIPTTTAYSSPVEIEPGGDREFSSDDVVIPNGLTNEVIRIRLRYRNLDRPDKILPPQDIYQLWAGNRDGNPSLFFSEIDEKTNKDIKEYFERNVPTQR